MNSRRATDPRRLRVPAPWCPSSVAFGQAIAAPFARMLRRRRRADLLLVHPRTPLFTSTVHRHLHRQASFLTVHADVMVGVADSVRVRLLSSRSADVRTHTRKVTAVEAPEQRRPERSALVPRLAARAVRTETAPVTALLQRVSLPVAPDTMRHRRPNAATDLPVVRSADRGATMRENVERAVAGRSTGTARERDRDPGTESSHRPATPWPMADVDQLTSRVIQTIDQRIAAARERLGRA